jgi:hypothetical protein
MTGDQIRRKRGGVLEWIMAVGCNYFKPLTAVQDDWTKSVLTVVTYSSHADDCSKCRIFHCHSTANCKVIILSEYSRSCPSDSIQKIIRTCVCDS